MSEYKEDERIEVYNNDIREWVEVTHIATTDSSMVLVYYEDGIYEFKEHRKLKPKKNDYGGVVREDEEVWEEDGPSCFMSGNVGMYENQLKTLEDYELMGFLHEEKEGVFSVSASSLMYVGDSKYMTLFRDKGKKAKLIGAVMRERSENVD